MGKANSEEFTHMESIGGFLLAAASVIAMVIVNSPFAYLYDALLGTPVGVQVGSFFVTKPLLLWINDGLMALFFLLVGLEIKREVMEGELSNPSQIVMPAVGALGGMMVPALIYTAFNYKDSMAINGWAIPTATDIAFALGILALLGSRVPSSMKIFLMTLAVFDDLAAIIIIAIFYSADLSSTALMMAGACIMILVALNRLGVKSIAAYAAAGTLLWLCVLKSGVHATLAGVIIALAIPMRTRRDDDESVLHELESDLHPLVSFGVLPVFAFANAGASLSGLSLADLLSPIPFGIAAGLFIGKQAGVFGFVWVYVKLGLGRLPEDITWGRLYGISLLCGVGFTMSLFIGTLAFEHAGEAGADAIMANRLGVLTGSLISGAAGYLLLRRLLGK